MVPRRSRKGDYREVESTRIRADLGLGNRRRHVQNGLGPGPADHINRWVSFAEPWCGLNPGAVLGVSRPALSNLLNQNGNLSGEMALRIEKAFGVNMETLMRMQAAYDIAQARKDAGRIRVRRYQSASTHA